MNCKIKPMCQCELCSNIFLMSHDFSKYTLKNVYPILFVYGKKNLMIKFSIELYLVILFIYYYIIY